MYIHIYIYPGVTSGGDYTDRETGNSCKPYDFKSCAHHITPPEGKKSYIIYVKGLYICVKTII
jgi:hypothetical protein